MSLPAGRSPWASLLLILAGLLVCLAFHQIGRAHFGGFALDLGSITMPTPVHLGFLAVYSVLGMVAAALLCVGLAGLAAASSSTRTVIGRFQAIPAGHFLVVATAAGLLGPVLLRLFLLEEALLTDDESCYHFTAELLANGRLHAESHPLRLFFDRAFMVNDGKFYSQYFVGWPLLMAPGVWLGIPGYMNAIYSALTVPALFLILRRLAGDGAAKITVLVFLLSPLLQIGSATEMSHTSCLFAASWCYYFTLRTRDENPKWQTFAAVSTFFCIAFYVRPTVALGLGSPLMLVTLHSSLRQSFPARARSLAAILVPSVVLGTLFLLIVRAQTGDAFVPPYQRVIEYSERNGFLFSGYAMGQSPELPGLDLRDPIAGFGRWGVGLFRLNFALFGWPSSFALLLFAGSASGTRLAWATAVSFLLVHLPMLYAGVDSFGPVHYTELALPALVLTGIGYSRATRLTESLARSTGEGEETRMATTWRFLPAAGVAALVLTSLAFYVPVRAAALGRIATDIVSPHRVAEQLELHNAVVFAPRPFTPRCNADGLRVPAHYAFWRPVNDPNMQNDILWVNHLSLRRDRELMAHFPGRAGYILMWTVDCTVSVLAIDEVTREPPPNGIVRIRALEGGGYANDLYDDSMPLDGTP